MIAKNSGELIVRPTPRDRENGKRCHPPEPIQSSVRTALAELAFRAGRGDGHAFELLHERLGSTVEAFFRRRLGASPELVEELAQRTWVEVWRSLGNGRFDPERAAFKTYLLGIGYKVYLRHRRSRGLASGRRPAVERFVEESLAARADDGESSEADRLLDLCATLDALTHCVHSARSGNRLSHVDMGILEGMLEGLSERGLADRLGVAPSTVNARKQSALGLLRRCLARKGFR